MIASSGRRLLLVVSLMLSMLLSVHAQNAPIPVTVQYRLLIKILEFDRHFEWASGKDVVLGIVYQRKFRPSLEAQEQMMNLIQNSGTEGGLHFRAVAIDLIEGVDLQGEMVRNNISLLYVAPLRSINIEAITSVSRSLKLNTFTGVIEYANHGIGITIGIKDDKPQIIVNLAATKAEGSKYSSQLLGLARVIE